MELKITAENANGLKVKLIDLCKVFGIEAEEKQMSMPLSTPAPAQAEKNEEKPKAAAKKTTAKKVESEPVATSSFLNEEAPAATTQAAPAATQALPTKAQLTKATEDVVGKFNLQKAIDLLGKFGASRLSMLKEENYAEYISECEKVLK